VCICVCVRAHACSIDPVGCTDVDDTMHVRALPDGRVEVGVHIADVRCGPRAFECRRRAVVRTRSQCTHPHRNDDGAGV